MTRLARLLLLTGTIGHALVYLWAAPEHVIDTSWPGHARFHVLQALIWALGFDGVLAAIALAPPSRRNWWVLLLGGGILHASYFIALAVFPHFGPPGLTADLVLALVALTYFSGVALARPRSESFG